MSTDNTSVELNGNNPVASQAIEPCTAEGPANNGVVHDSPANNQTKETKQQVMSETQNVLANFKTTGHHYGSRVFSESFGEQQQANGAIRYPITPDEFTLDNIVPDSLREKFAFTPGLSGFELDDIIKPSGMFVALIAMKVNYDLHPIRQNRSCNLNTPVAPSIIAALLENDKVKEGKEPRLAFGHEGHLVSTQAHGFYSSPFGKDPDGFDRENRILVPSFTKERRRGFVKFASEVVLRNPENYIEAVVQLAKKVEREGPQSLSYEEGNNEQEVLLSATDLLDNVCQIFYTGVFDRELGNASDDLLRRLETSRSNLMHRFNEIAYAAKIHNGKTALFCLVGFFDRFFITPPKAENKHKFANTVRVRTCTEFADQTKPVGFFVGVQALERHEKRNDPAGTGGAGSLFLLERYGKVEPHYQIPETALSSSVITMEQSRKDAYYARIAAEAKASTNATPSEAQPVVQAKPKAPTISHASRPAATEQVNGMTNSSFIQNKAELATEELAFKDNERIGRIFLTHAACLIGMTVTEYHIPVLPKVQAFLKTAEANARNKEALAKNVKALEATAKDFYQDQKNVEDFFRAYDAAIEARVNITMQLQALETQLKVARPTAIVDYIKQVAVVLRYAKQPGAGKSEATREISEKLYKNFFEDYFFSEVREGKAIEFAAVETLRFLQEKRLQQVPGMEPKITFAQLLEGLFTELYTDGNTEVLIKRKEWRGKELAKLNAYIKGGCISSSSTSPQATEEKEVKVETTSSNPPAELESSPQPQAVVLQVEAETKTTAVVTAVPENILSNLLQPKAPVVNPPATETAAKDDLEDLDS